MSRNCENFNFDGCSFSIQKAKETTARVVGYREFGIINSYTLECSFFGPNKGPYKDCHFSISMLLDIGQAFCQSLLDMIEKEQIKVSLAIKEIKKLMKKGNG
jgi:hypothetical protein